LSQILLDPYFRTIDGIIVLIEKDWLSFGHQFALRNGINSKEIHEDQNAPIFLQWLDCLHQLIGQFPNAFEYNTEFLLFIAFHYNSNLYGTFLYNSELERLDKDAKNKTVSIWTDVFNSKNRFKNHFYQEQNCILTPNYSFHKLRFWEEFFLKYNNTYTGRKVCLDSNKGTLTKSPDNYFLSNKIQDNIKIEELQKKLNEFYEILSDIYSKTSNKEIFDEFTESTKFHLTNFNKEIRDDEQLFKEN
jgi:hypothetical protein